MNRRIRFHDGALADIKSAAQWYDRQRAGLGSGFLFELDARLAQIGDASGLGVQLPGAPKGLAMRQVQLSRFPYVVVFIEFDDELRVIAVMHHRRRPGRWLRRVKK